MACAASLQPTEGNTRHLKWMYLLMKGGVMVLRDIFNAKVPPANLVTHINKPKVKNKILNLHKDKRITDTQKNLLIPPAGQLDSSSFDITLLSCLLQNICGLNSQSTAWSGAVDPADVSVEADICRLRSIRNEVCHSGQTSMTEQEFQTSCSQLEQVLLRLGQDIPGLKTAIENLKTNFIDKECEQALLNKIQEWEELDIILQESVKELEAKHKNHSEKLTSLTGEVTDLRTEEQKGYKARSELQGQMKQQEATLDYMRNIEVPDIRFNVHDLKSKTEEHDQRINDMDIKVSQTVDAQTGLGRETQTLKNVVDDVKASQGKLKEDLERVKAERLKKKELLSSELKSIASTSQLHLKDALKNQEFYVKTRAHTKAKEMLLVNNIVVISGHPGEGKTTMALQLATEITELGHFLRIRDPTDWLHVDLSLGLFDTFLIDDIYGAGVMTDALVKQWDRYLPDINKAVENKAVRVIIATRHYILEEANEKMKKQRLFKEDNIIQLASKNLTERERMEILKKHLAKHERESENLLISDCSGLFEDFLEMSITLRTSELVFGFPQCVEMFASNDTLFDRGAKFFSHPNEFFRACIEDLSRDDEKFLALMMIWSRQGKPLFLEELDLSSTSHELKKVATSFGFKLKPKRIKILRKSLGYHTGGFVDYNSENCSYSFSHRVISDMVGLVIGKQYPDATLEYITRDFLLEYLTINGEKRNDYHYFIQKYLHKKLINILIKMLLEPPRVYLDENVRQFKSGGNCPNNILPTLQVDSNLIVCDAFDNEGFVKAFFDELNDTQNEDKLEKFLTTSVMKMSGHFLGMGLKLEKEIDITLPEYFLMNENCLVLRQLINRNKTKMPQNGLEIALLIAVHGDLTDCVSFLLENGAEPTEEAKYIAAVKENCDILKLLLNKKDHTQLTTRKKCTIFNGSSALLAASKKGLLTSVKCLVENGADINYRNADGVNALEKAILYETVDRTTDGLNALDKAFLYKTTAKNEICKLLIEAGSSLNHRSGKFKRTPLHLAADVGLVDIVKMLLQHGASTTVKDHRGHYPIHCAAIGGCTDVVKAFLEHDKHLSKQRIVSYSKKSVIKGMTVLHIAVWKNNLELLDTLIEMQVDFDTTDVYGRTAFYCAVYDGKESVVDKLLGVADLNKTEKQGYTPLHAALQRGHSQIAEKLCPLVDVNVCDKHGRTPLHVSIVKHRSALMIKLIKEHNADMSASSRKGTRGGSRESIEFWRQIVSELEANNYTC